MRKFPQKESVSRKPLQVSHNVTVVFCEAILKKLPARDALLFTNTQPIANAENRTASLRYFDAASSPLPSTSNTVHDQE